MNFQKFTHTCPNNSRHTAITLHGKGKCKGKEIRNIIRVIPDRLIRIPVPVPQNAGVCDTANGESKGIVPGAGCDHKRIIQGALVGADDRFREKGRRFSGYRPVLVSLPSHTMLPEFPVSGPAGQRRSLHISAPGTLLSPSPGRPSGLVCKNKNANIFLRDKGDDGADTVKGPVLFHNTVVTK